MYGTQYHTSPGRGVKNVYIKDMVYDGSNANSSQMLGYDAVAVNLKINGKPVFDDMGKPSWYFTSQQISFLCL